ncbi:MAG TPA: AgmX/PglI C-terminal domain-containing protein, partial [Cellvibrionaceae bacterium]|nr:AgmX/PglI C-terminal domain-containing protein [Cellvibrionaceae bacterium]
DDDPTLQGRMVFKLTIEPSGAVSNVLVVSSALKNDDLQRKITALLRGLNFGARDVAVYTQTVPIDLFPS